MSNCPDCQAVGLETVRLWDGRDYCRACLRNFSEELEVYATDHDTLRASPEIFAEAVDWKRLSHQSSLFCAGVFTATVAFGLTLPDDKVSISWPMPVVFCLMVFVITYIFGRLHSMFLFSFRPLLITYFPVPAVEIDDGKMTLYFKTLSFSLFSPIIYVDKPICSIGLENVRIVRNEDCPDRHFAMRMYFVSRQNLLWLDLSVAVAEWDLRNRQFFTLCKHPYLVCCCDPKIWPVWEKFFQIVDGTANLKPLE